MSELFEGTPAIVSVTIADREGKQVKYYVAGQDLDKLAESVREALSALPAEGASQKSKKPRKKRRTKAEMATAAKSNEGETPEPDSGINRAPRNKKERLAVAVGEKVWA